MKAIRSTFRSSRRGKCADGNRRATRQQILVRPRASYPGSRAPAALVTVRCGGMAMHAERPNAGERSLWEEHGALVGRVCMALLGSPSETDEAVEATFAAAVAKPRDPNASPRAQLCAIARAECARRAEA